MGGGGDQEKRGLDVYRNGGELRGGRKPDSQGDGDQQK